MVWRIFLITSVLLISACQQSPRKEYFALSTPIPVVSNGIENRPLPNNSTTPVQLVGLGPIIIPEYLQHSRISYWKTPNQLSLQENHYWAEPLEQGVSRALGLQLQTAHPQWRVVQFPWRNSQQPAYAIRVDIQHLDAYSDHAIIAAGLDLVDVKTNQIVRSKQFSARVTSAAHSADIAQAFSELLQQTAASMDSLLLTTGK